MTATEFMSHVRLFVLLNAATCSLPLNNKIHHEYIFGDLNSGMRAEDTEKENIEDLMACAFVCRQRHANEVWGVCVCERARAEKSKQKEDRRNSNISV